MDYVIYLVVCITAAVVLAVVLGCCIVGFIWLLDRSKVQEARPHVIKAMVWLALSFTFLEVGSVLLAVQGRGSLPSHTVSESVLVILLALPGGISLLLCAHYIGKWPHVVTPSSSGAQSGGAVDCQRQTAIPRPSPGGLFLCQIEWLDGSSEGMGISWG